MGNARRAAKSSTTARATGDAEGRRLRAMERTVDRAVGRTGVAEWDAGKKLDEIVASNLYTRVAPTVREYVEKRFHEIGYTTLHRYRAVAKRFPRRAAKHGMYRLWLGLEHIDATPADEKPADLLRMEIVLADGSRKPFLKCSPEEIEAATRALGGAARDADVARRTTLPRGAGPRIEKLRTEIAKGVAPAERPDVEARVIARGKQRTVAVTLRDVLLDQLPSVARAILRAAKA